MDSGAWRAAVHGITSCSHLEDSHTLGELTWLYLMLSLKIHFNVFLKKVFEVSHNLKAKW